MVPTPSWLSAVMVPPCKPTSSLTNAKPIPLPSVDRARAVLDAMETFEEPGHLRGRDSDPGVGDRDDRIGVLAADPDRDGALEGVLQRIGEQVEHHLLPHLTVQMHRLVEWRAVHG